ncbi:Ulp1 protease family, C-terminal catalytic domain [Sesbania bispinosa]|nr:Ulp1 protease family, C-terminal catalytic domain [Sesbania bispinosa]
MEQELGCDTMDLPLEEPISGSVANDDAPLEETMVFEEVPSVKMCIETRIEQMAHTQAIMLKKLIHLEYLMPIDNILGSTTGADNAHGMGACVADFNKMMDRVKKENFESHEVTEKVSVSKVNKSKSVVNISDDEDIDFDKLDRIKSRMNTSPPVEKDNEQTPKVTCFAQTKKERVYGKLEKFEYKPQSAFYRRGSQQKEIDGSVSETQTTFVRKKLKLTPAADNKDLNDTPFEPSMTPTKRTNVSMKSSTNSSSKDKGSSNDDGTQGRHSTTKNTPKVIKTKFKPSKDMNLTDDQAKLSAYVFFHQSDPSEVIFKCRGVVGTINDFDTLSPDRGLSPEIITFVANKTMFEQEQLKKPTVWSFPPSFVMDVMRKKTMEELIIEYLIEWMPHYSDLKYMSIYVPIEEASGHWYLIVISLVEKVVYHLDSLLDEKNVNPRRFTIGKVHFPPDFGKGWVEVENWEVTEAIGNNYGTWSDSAIWVCDWMKMEGSFQPNFHGSMNEKLVRMKIAMSLLAGGHNECWETLKAKVDTFWQMAT